MTNTLHLKRPQQPRSTTAPAPKSWRNLIGKKITVRLKSGVTASGVVNEVALNVMTLKDCRLLERDAVDWLVPKGLVHLDASSISFAIEGAKE